jgi:ABC-type oligopeptide transport system substrate-binding subunit
MYTETSDARRMASEYIQSSLEKLFGTDKFSMTLSANSFSLLNETMRSSVVGPTNAWDLCWSAWGLTAEKTHPYKKGERYTTWYARRYTTYQNTVIDTLWEQCKIEENRLDDEKMASITVAMEKAILDDMTCVPVYQPNNFVMYADRIDLPMNVYHNDIGFGWTYSKLK